MMVQEQTIEILINALQKLIPPPDSNRSTTTPGVSDGGDGGASLSSRKSEASSVATVGAGIGIKSPLLNCCPQSSDIREIVVTE